MMVVVSHTPRRRLRIRSGSRFKARFAASVTGRGQDPRISCQRGHGRHPQKTDRAVHPRVNGPILNS